MYSLNLNVSGLPKSATLAINERCREMRNKGRNIYNFGLGQSPFPVPDMVCNSLLENTHQKDYLAVEGLWELREAIAAYHSRINTCSYTGNQVMVGPGSKELMFLVQLVYYGDLIIPIPSWVSYAPQAQIIGRHVQWLPTSAESNWMMTAESLEAHCHKNPNRPRLVILNYPSNPTGATLSDDELRDIAEVARKYNLILLSDEIYGELQHDGNHTSIACYYPEATIISAGLSKWCGAGGWRLGYFVFPEERSTLMNAMAVAASETFTSTSAPIQYAAVSAYQKNAELRSYTDNSRKILQMICRYATNALRSAGLSFPNPRGAFYLFLDFAAYRDQLKSKSITNNHELSEFILEQTGVAALPGQDFGCPATDLTLRMAYVDFDGQKALDLFENYQNNELSEEDFLRQACPNVLEGTERLVNEIESW